MKNLPLLMVVNNSNEAYNNTYFDFKGFDVIHKIPKPGIEEKHYATCPEVPQCAGKDGGRTSGGARYSTLLKHY